MLQSLHPSERTPPTALAPESEFLERYITSKLLSFSTPEIIARNARVSEVTLRNFSLIQNQGSIKWKHK
ncbi:hypothetical protein F2Q70_00018328 [Brassica cretica]|uniref:Uncharacterized protein n=1 Tax=Brassica cretica TaxID=69181 RepID=A0A8S9KN97_BRACR|nr:hypothetical protein F2Q70_00018328 [Brassica cretica]KAF2596740.1 hypothetical protein F2Q68_00011590 [Brassica cretica]